MMIKTQHSWKPFFLFLLLIGIHFQLLSQREVVITIDDLPIVSQIRTDEHLETVNKGILSSLRQYKVPAIGFVNEGKLYKGGKLESFRVDILQTWIDAGLELGNHGFAHKDYNRVDEEEYQEDILKGEKITKAMLAKAGKQMRYFRNPYLHTGNSSEKKTALEAFLSKHTYQIAPVTIDNSEWIYARAYENAFLEKDSALMHKIGTSYVSYIEDKTAYYEAQAQMLFGRNIKQILLLHANTLNGDYLDELLDMYQKRGYTFIPLSEALTDEAYTSPDTFTGRAGISWIHRWAITRQVDKSFFKGEPACPEFIQEVAGIQE